MLNIKDDFIKKIKEELSDYEFNQYINSLQDKPMHGFSINLKKLKNSSIDLDYIVKKFKAKIGFINDYFAYIIYDKEELKTYSVFPGRDPLYHAGLYYIQEPSAAKVLQDVEFSPSDKVLDLCAAPGGKSIEALYHLDINKGGFIVSNEIKKDRVKILSSNIERMGFDNSIVISNDVKYISSYFDNYFDKIILDAPCSGEGMFRKSEDARLQWSNSLVKSCACMQKELIDYAMPMLSCGGVLIYSTCTFSREEDEENVDYILSRYDDIKLVKKEKIYPFSGIGEGQFYAIFKKDGDKINDFFMPPLNFFKGLNVLRYGLNLYNDNNKRIEPSHASTHNDNVKFDNVVELDDDEIKRYLIGDVIRKENVENGWCKITYKGLGVGLGKITSGTIKNHYPKGLRNMNE